MPQGGVTSCPPKRVELKLPLGYLMVRSMRGGVRVYGLAHRLVWQWFNGDIPAGKTINHKNGIKNDNRLSNLEVASYSEQQRHAYRIGLRDEHGEANPAAKLTDNQIGQIRQAYASRTHNMQQLAGLFGVRVQHISRLIRGTRRRKQGGVTFDIDLRHASDCRDPHTGRFTRVAA